MQRLIKRKQIVGLKSYIVMNTQLQKDAKMIWNDAIFGKAMQNVGKYRDIKLVTT